MGFYDLRGCCCCFNLKNGSLIIATLAIIGSCLGLLSGINEALTHQNYDKFEFLLTDENLNFCGNETVCKEYFEYFKSAYVPALVFIFVRNVISLISSSVLVHGIKKERPGLMIPYILLETVELVVGNFAVLILALLVGNPVLVGIFCFLMMITSILPIYFILVLRSHYYELLRAQGQIPSELVNEKQFMVVA